MTVDRSGSGAGTVIAEDINCGQDCVGAYPTGTPVRLMAYPAQGSTFRGWTGCDYTAGNECVVTADTDVVVGAEFVPTTPPDTRITAAKVRSEKRRATFEFTGSSPLGTVTFECRIDGKEFAACTSPRTFRRLRPGSHTFQVRAVDSSRADPTPAGKRFAIRR